MAKILAPLRKEAIRLHFEEGLTPGRISNSEGFKGVVHRKTIYDWIAKHKEQREQQPIAS